MKSKSKQCFVMCVNVFKIVVWSLLILILNLWRDRWIRINRDHTRNLKEAPHAFIFSHIDPRIFWLVKKNYFLLFSAFLNKSMFLKRFFIYIYFILFSPRKNKILWKILLENSCLSSDNYKHYYLFKLARGFLYTHFCDLDKKYLTQVKGSRKIFWMKYAFNTSDYNRVKRSRILFAIPMLKILFWLFWWVYLN